MSAIRTILAETLALFVDDGPFALAILACLAIAALLLRLAAGAALFAGPGLFFALAGVLIWSAWRRSSAR